MGSRKRKPSGKASDKNLSRSKRPKRAFVPQPHGGALLPGAGGGPQPGSGRPPDALRAKLREVGMNKGVTLLDRVLDTVLTIPLVGKCRKCGEEQELDPLQRQRVGEEIGGLVNQQLKATDVALKYGLTTKELTITSQDAAAFFDCVHTACVELVGDAMAESIKQRAIQLAEQRK